ncbi:MAG TPA: SurA N-terminal domain-containing protein [Bauldia sp.]|nr:SurA N-terminal domain-containing protein [Bauldia sp.]
MARAIGLIIAALMVVTATLAEAPVAFAASTIRVKVNDQPITSYDIAQRAALLRLTGAKGGEKAALEELIDETLQFIEGAKRGVSISDARVDQVIAGIASSMKMTPAQLKKALSQQGVDITTLRRRLKSQMVWQQVIAMKARFESSVKSSDITAALFQDGNAEKFKTTEFTLQQIIFVVPKGSAAGLFDQRRREAEAFRQRFPGCDKSVDQAKLLKGVVVRNIGRRTSDELTGPDGKEIMGTPAGKTTRPTKTDQGINVIAVCSTRELSTDAAVRSETEMRLLMEKNKDLGKEYLAELRKKAVIEYR